MDELKPEWQRNTKFTALRLKAEEMQKLDILCEVANRGRSTLIRYLINDAYHRAVMKGRIQADEAKE